MADWLEDMQNLVWNYWEILQEENKKLIKTLKITSQPIPSLKIPPGNLDVYDQKSCLGEGDLAT